MLSINTSIYSGGFVAPFVAPDLVWDFQLERVHSINVSGHKYGLTYPGIGWALWRGKEYLPEELIFNINYLGSDQVCLSCVYFMKIAFNHPFLYIIRLHSHLTLVRVHPILLRNIMFLFV